jgi:hypothetical protein
VVLSHWQHFDAGREIAMMSGDEIGRLEKRMVVEYGITLDGVWLPLAMLRRLATHGPWDQAFTEATTDQERVLLAHGLAERHNQAGLHRGIGLRGFLDAIPYEPTESFQKVTGDGDHPQS